METPSRQRQRASISAFSLGRMHAERLVAEHVQQRRSELTSRGKGAVGFGEHKEPRVRGHPGGERGARGRQRSSVEVLQRGNDKPVPEHGLDGCAAILSGRVEGGHRIRSIRRWKEAEPRRCDDPQGAFRADEEALQIEARDVLANRTADRDDLTGRQDRFQPRDPRAGDAVLERVRAAGVGRYVPADLGLLGRAGIRREEEAAFTNDAAELRSPETCLDPDAPEERLERAHAREPLQRDDDAAVQRDRSGSEAGSSSPRDDRDTVLVAPGDDLGDLLGSLRHDDGVRAAPHPARLGLVGEIRSGSSLENGAGRKERAKLALELRRHAKGTVEASCCDSSAAVKMRCVCCASVGVAQ